MGSAVAWNRPVGALEHNGIVRFFYHGGVSVSTGLVVIYLRFYLQFFTGSGVVPESLLYGDSVLFGYVVFAGKL